MHAGKKLDKVAYETLTECGVELPPVDELKFGGIIGEAEIIDCVDSSDSEWFMGPYGFELCGAKKTKFKPCRGKLGFFEIN